MKIQLVSLSLFAAATLVSGAAHATTYYVSDCQTGAASGCVAGNDSNTGTSTAAPWRSTAKVQAQFASLAAGDQILFARGGSWTNASMVLQNVRSSAASPITMDAYTPASGATARPLLTESRSGTNLIAFDNGGTAVADGGYVVRNLDLRGGGTAQWGVFTSQATSDIIMSNLNIEGFVIGVHCGESIERVQLLNSTLTNNGSQGILWGCINSRIEGNTFNYNGYLSTDGRDHSVYLGNGTSSAVNVTFRGNTLLNNSVPKSGGICGGVPLVVHGMWNGVTIEGNTIYQAPGTANSGCWGIAVDAGYGSAEIFSKVVIRGNTIVNVGGIGIGCASCVSPLIENNVVVMESGDLVGIQIPDRTIGAGDAADTGGVIRNNTIYFKSPTFAQGISLATQGGSTAGTNLKVVSNLVYIGSTSSTNHQCYDTTGISLSNFAAFDYNLCYDASGNGRYSPAYATLANAKAAGFDAHGLNSNPLFAAVPSSSNKWSVALSANSPAINAGSPTGSSLTDVLSISRSTPDIGAAEYGSSGDTVPPAPPQSVVIQ